jgi:hypothetical protein
MNGTPVQMPDASAGDELAGGSPMGASKDITIPADLMPGCKAGDTYTVKSMDGDNVTLEASGGEPDSDEWGKGAVDFVKQNGGSNE